MSMKFKPKQEQKGFLSRFLTRRREREKNKQSLKQKAYEAVKANKGEVEIGRPRTRR